MTARGTDKPSDSKLRVGRVPEEKRMTDKISARVGALRERPVAHVGSILTGFVARSW